MTFGHPKLLNAPHQMPIYKCPFFSKGMCFVENMSNRCIQWYRQNKKVQEY